MESTDLIIGQSKKVAICGWKFGRSRNLAVKIILYIGFQRGGNTKVNIPAKQI